ncbi:MAG: amidohydrolase family protein [Planctomycetota bacterium]
MLIDIHVHTCRPRRFTFMPWCEFPSPAQLLSLMDAARIDKAVLLSVISPEWGFPIVTPEEVMDICSERPDRFIPFANVDPRMLRNCARGDLRPVLRRFKEVGFKGIGEYMPTLPFDDPANVAVFRQVEEVDLPLTFHIAPVASGVYGCYDELGLPRLENVLKLCPKLNLLGHSPAFWAEISSDVTDSSRQGYPTGKVTPGRVVDLLRAYPNLYGDLSAGSGYNAISRDPDFACGFLEEFQDRLLFGTDVTHAAQDLPIVPFFRELREKRLISPEALDKISWRNANSILDLHLTP